MDCHATRAIYVSLSIVLLYVTIFIGWGILECGECDRGFPDAHSLPFLPSPTGEDYTFQPPLPFTQVIWLGPTSGIGKNQCVPLLTFSQVIIVT